VTGDVFPRYLFVALDLARDRWRTTQSTFGVCSIVLAGEEPVALSDNVVEDIRASEDDDGYVRFGLRRRRKQSGASCEGSICRS
jgi:transcriptional antiterminator RfaH